MRPLSLWTRYGDLGASSRLRFRQYVPFLTAAGWDVTRYEFFTDDYLRRLYAGKGRSFAALVSGWGRRRREMRREAPDTPALIEYELLPYLPPAWERKFLASRKYVLNFDDAVELRYARFPGLRDKFRELVSGAAGVIVANAALHARFAPFNANVLDLPTVPPPLPPDFSPEPAARFTLVWIGTPVTFAYLRERSEALRQAARTVDMDLLIVGGTAPLPGIRCELIPWSEAAELAALRRANVGIMPLPDTPFARGKSAYKLLRYLQCGLPAVASPVGENRRVLRPGETGFFAETDAEWAEVVSRLADPARRAAMRPAIRSAAAEYTLAAAADRLTAFLRVLG
ncbi:MAG: glycosyltransferase [Lentisphaeria bacterium]|nr:glycosyltransferase [Lentisphaeria bacterium]